MTLSVRPCLERVQIRIVRHLSLYGNFVLVVMMQGQMVKYVEAGSIIPLEIT
jgi:hypothetical protein